MFRQLQWSCLVFLTASLFGCQAKEGDPPAPFMAFNFAVLSPGDTQVAEFDGSIINFAGPNGVIVSTEETFVTALHNGGTAALTPSTLYSQQSPSVQINIGAASESVLVSGDSFATVAGGAANPSAGGGFGAFSGAANFSSIGNTITVSFTTSNGSQAGFVTSFGLVFTDVEAAGKSGLRFLNSDGNEILNLRCPAGASGAHRFVGAVFSQAQIASVKIDMGDNVRFGTAPESPTTGGDDYVVIDDIHFDLSQLPIGP